MRLRLAKSKVIRSILGEEPLMVLQIFLFAFIFYINKCKKAA